MNINTAQPDYEAAHELLRRVIYAGAGRVNALVAELWTWDSLPAKFQVGGEKWEEIESRIFDAARKGYWWDVATIGSEYLARIDAFCKGWREQGKPKTKGASQ
jgi:hypothetical protein